MLLVVLTSTNSLASFFNLKFDFLSTEKSLEISSENLRSTMTTFVIEM